MTFIRTHTLLPCTLTLALSLLSGCVTVYQPLQTLARPVALDITEANFEGLKVLVRCPAGEFVKAGDAKRLCNKIQRVFTNQGALTEGGLLSAKPARRSQDPEPQAAAPGMPASPKVDLIIDLKGRLLHFDIDKLMGALCVVSLTLVPCVSDTSLAQDVTIRDGDGFVLATDSFQARFVSYFGLAMWAVNGLLDLLVRAPEDRLIGNAQKAEVSDDFYSQLSQLALHARMRSLTQRNFETGP